MVEGGPSAGEEKSADLAAGEKRKGEALLLRRVSLKEGEGLFFLW